MVNDRDFLSVSEALTRSVGHISGRDVVDIGCGGGSVTEVLVSLGARVTGIEPNPEALAQARERVRATLVEGSAEDTGLAGNGFDIAIFSNSLHHTRDPFAALKEAERIVRPGGRIVVIEPQAPDPIYDVVRFIDDEAPVYESAQNAIDTLVAQGHATRRPPLLYAAKYRVTTPRELLDDMICVDSSRRLKDADFPDYERAFKTALRTDADGCFLPYWQRLDVLDLPSSPPVGKGA